MLLLYWNLEFIIQHGVELKYKLDLLSTQQVNYKPWLAWFTQKKLKNRPTTLLGHLMLVSTFGYVHN